MTGLSVAVIVNQFIYETGYSIAALLVDAGVLEYHILPLPNVLCNVSDATDFGKVLIGISRTLFLIILSLIINLKRFMIWYENALICGICTQSLIAMILF